MSICKIGDETTVDVACAVIDRSHLPFRSRSWSAFVPSSMLVPLCTLGLACAAPHVRCRPSMLSNVLS